MSGTPLVNQPMDLFIIFKSLGYEENSYTAFKIIIVFWWVYGS